MEKLRDVINHLYAKSNLTTLANDMGFADTAHFSRTCLSSFGLKPSEPKRPLISQQNNNHTNSIDCFNNNHQERHLSS